ncbi:cylicin-2 isoform X2 [Drosophila kikkawai]|uniref:Cylicin-2 isoform X2 n=1 Tax=Drosophila kikkawai TaxID=30033 RepID=A0ABM4GP37_DROKI
MEKYIEYKCCNPASSTSSSTKIFCDGEKLCNPCGCYRCCKSAFFNDHTYSILKRICHKIIQNQSRQRCRENYSVFDGGNSTIIRPAFKGQQDGTDLFNNCIPTQSVSLKSGHREQKHEYVRVPDLKRNEIGKSNAAWYENMGQRQNSKKPYISGDNDETNIGRETKMIRKGPIRYQKGNKNEETVTKNNIDVLENGLNKYSKENNNKDTSILKKGDRRTDDDKNGSKKSARPNSSDRNFYKDEKFVRDKNQGKSEGKDSKNRETKAKQLKLEKNVDHDEMNKNEESERKEKKSGESKAKQANIERNGEQGKINNNEEKEGKYREKKTLKAQKSKIDKNLDQGEIKKNEEKEGREKKNGESEAKQSKFERNVDQDKINKNNEKEGKYRKNRIFKAEKNQIEKNVDQGEINRNEEEEKDRKNSTSKISPTKNYNVDPGKITKNEEALKISKKSGKRREKRIGELNQENGNKKDEQKGGKDNKIKKRKIDSNDKDKNGQSYQAMSKKQNAEIFVQKDLVDDMKTQSREGKPKRIALGPTSKKNAKSKFNTGYRKSNQLFEKKDIFFKKRITKGQNSKILSNRKKYSSKGILFMPRELQSCRYVRPCDILRVKLEERDLSRCIACCFPFRPYVSCSSYQCGLPCGE